MSTVFKKIACFQEKIARLMNFARGSYKLRVLIPLEVQ